MAMTLKDLESQLSGLQTYTPETEDALRTRAENIYNPQYQQDLQSLRDSLQQGLNQQSRNAISAGMQRSSYNQSALAALRGQGLRAEAQLGAQRDANIANLLNQLIEGEKDRKLNADANRDNLLLQLYQLANKGGSGKGKDQTNPLAASDEMLKLLFGATPNKVTTKSMQGSMTEEQRKEYAAVSAAQRNAARRGQTYTGPAAPTTDTANASIRYNPYSYAAVTGQSLEDVLEAYRKNGK